jgi:hypothetical protein
MQENAVRSSPRRGLEWHRVYQERVVAAGRDSGPGCSACSYPTLSQTTLCGRGIPGHDDA